MTSARGSKKWSLRGGWAWVDANHEAITILFAVIAALYVLFEYRSNEEHEKVKRTLELQARFSQGELLAARVKLNTLLLDPTNKGKIDNEKGDAKLKKITELVREAKLEGGVLMLADFFNQAAICIEHKICDVETACAAFRSEAKALKNTYHDLFLMWKIEWGEDPMEPSFTVFKEKCTAS